MIGRTHSKQAEIQRYSLILEMRLLIAVVSLSCLIAFSTMRIQTANAATTTQFVPATTSYNCLAHCYGRDLWTFPGAITGGAVTITVNPMAQGDGFVTNEMWVDQPNISSGDCANQVDNCWVEAGYAAGGSSNGAQEYFFWADVRPCSCGGYHEHDSANLLGGDYGNVVNVGIFSNGSSTWDINVFGAATSLSGVSTGQTMNPTEILQGQELVGLSGVNTPTAHLTDSEWRDTNGVWSVEGADGTLDPCLNGCPNINPPWSGWVKGSDPRNFSGGDFYTCTLPTTGNNPC